MRGEAAPFRAWMDDTLIDADDESVMVDVLLDLWWQSYGKMGPRGISYGPRWMVGQLRDQGKEVVRSKVAGVQAQRCRGVVLRDGEVS